MALRAITSNLYTGGKDVLGEKGKWLTANPTHVLRLDQKVIPSRDMGVPITTIHVDHSADPTEDQIKAWMACGVPVLRSNGRLLVLDNDGNNRSCTVASVLLAVTTGEPWDKVLDGLHAKFIHQGGHNWWPYAHWKAAITRHWMRAVQPFKTAQSVVSTPAARPTPATRSATPVLDATRTTARAPKSRSVLPPPSPHVTPEG